MHISPRVSSELHSFRIWLTKASDDFLYLCLQYVQKIFPTKKYPEFKEEKTGDKEHLPHPTKPHKYHHRIERRDAPVRENLSRFKKGKKLGR